LYPGFPQKRVDPALKQGQDCGHDRRSRRLDRSGGGLWHLPPALAGASRAGLGRVERRDPPREVPFISEGRDVVTAGGRALDLRTDTFFKVPPLCTVGTGHGPRWVLLCGSARSLSETPQAIVELVGGKIVRRAPVKSPAPNTSPIGHWVGVQLSPDGRTLLAQWSAECETPQAFLVSRRTGTVRRLGGAEDNSIALGWTNNGRALIHFPTGLCGGTYHGGPGVYAVNRGQLRFVFGTARLAKVAMWGG
jgi:hypothetical protein